MDSVHSRCEKNATIFSNICEFRFQRESNAHAKKLLMALANTNVSYSKTKSQQFYKGRFCGDFTDTEVINSFIIRVKRLVFINVA